MKLLNAPPAQRGGILMLQDLIEANISDQLGGCSPYEMP